MHVLKGGLNGNDADDEFIKKLESQGYANRETRGHESTAEELRKALTGRQNAGSSGFLDVKEGLDSLVMVQSAIDHRIRTENSTILYIGDRVARVAIEKISGRRQDPKSLEQLFEDEVDVIRALSTSLTGALVYSEHVLDNIVVYRDDTVLAKFFDSIQNYEGIELSSKEVLSLYKEAEARLSKAHPNDPQYPMLYKAHSSLHRKLMSLDNELSKCNQTIVFRSAELDLLKTHIELVNYGVLLLDRLNNYVGDVAEHVDRTKEVYRFFRESYIGMDAVYSAFSELSRCVMTGAREMGQQISRMSEMARSTGGENMLPETLGRLLSGYKATIFSADSRSRNCFDSRANAIRQSRG
ncbi:hypothetical protein HYU11_04225 [Candidatus Woesearchaeota archaeon]|nr:hypothetical protein [Candidatus Woesearchaeota archaeon]